MEIIESVPRKAFHPFRSWSIVKLRIYVRSVSMVVAVVGSHFTSRELKTRLRVVEEREQTVFDRVNGFCLEFQIEKWRKVFTSNLLVPLSSTSTSGQFCLYYFKRSSCCGSTIWKKTAGKCKSFKLINKDGYYSSSINTIFRPELGPSSNTFTSTVIAESLMTSIAVPLRTTST